MSPTIAAIIAATIVAVIMRVGTICCTQCQAKGYTTDDCWANPAATAAGDHDLFSARVGFGDDHALVVRCIARQRLLDRSVNASLGG